MKLLFVCMGNICRSPTAKAMVDYHLRQQNLHPRITTASAGTHGYHIGKPPDPRSQAAALRQGVDISTDLARQLKPGDFHEFDYIMVMDENNLSDASRIAPGDASAELCLMMEFAPDYGMREVPDPYYGGEEGFLQVVDMLNHAAECLVNDLRQRLV